MNQPSLAKEKTTTQPSSHLLERISAIRERVGDGLNDDELTRLLREVALPMEAGFGFLSYSDGFVTLSVPRQDPANWYPEKGWIVSEKEKMAGAIAEEYGLSLCEPPDRSPRFLVAGAGAPKIHHHLELVNRWETVVVAHPCYLKVRLFGATAGSRFLSEANGPLRLGPGLLQNLAALYEA